MRWYIPSSDAQRHRSDIEKHVSVMPGFLVEIPGGALWAEQRGAGPDLVLLSGLGDTHKAWSAQLASLANRYRVTALDNRGTSRSSPPDHDFTVATMADDVAQAVKALEITEAHVAGFSMGGAIAQELALAHPELVSTLTINGSWCRTDAYQRHLFDSWIWMAQRAESDEAFVRAIYLWVYTRRAHLTGEVETWIRQALEEEHPQSTDAFVRTVEAIKQHDTAARLGRIDVPVLIVAGTEDMIFPPAVQEDMASRLSDCRLELMDGEAHQPFQESPAKFNDVLTEFLAASRRPPSGRRSPSA
jgi:pimeloyl-ACP methyl ester carboxylesterase